MAEIITERMEFLSHSSSPKSSYTHLPLHLGSPIIIDDRYDHNHTLHDLSLPPGLRYISNDHSPFPRKSSISRTSRAHSQSTTTSSTPSSPLITTPSIPCTSGDQIPSLSRLSISNFPDPILEEIMSAISPHSSPGSRSSPISISPSDSIVSLFSSPCLGPYSAIPPEKAPIKEWKILVICTVINSFTQRVLSYFKLLGFTSVSCILAGDDDWMMKECEDWCPNIVVCPFLTKRVPDSIYKRWITLVVHPGPPGDAGPSSLDWALMGDNGLESDSTKVLEDILTVPTLPDPFLGKPRLQRTHWGCIVFQANEHLDGGNIWAWDQYIIPDIGSITKAQLYQRYHSQAAISCVINSLFRIYDAVHSQTTVSLTDPTSWVHATPETEWSKLSLTGKQIFQGGSTHERPLLPANKRRPDWNIHHADDIIRLINASDSQPGAQLHPLTENSKTALFAYGAHVHKDRHKIPLWILDALGYPNWTDIPFGAIVAKRDGAILVKTRPCMVHNDCGKCGVAVWITHGRIPKAKDKPLEPKIPMVMAIERSGHVAALKRVVEWPQERFEEEMGVWQQVFLRPLERNGEIVQRVYWDFYNGAFTTQNCQLLLSAIRYAVETPHPKGQVKILALMGGSYFSNGIALNTIEASPNPGKETWANINAIDDIVEYLVGDTKLSRSPWMEEGVEKIKPLCRRGIVTVACIRSNAAAGGVALAAACDVVVAGRGVVLNPAYRAMGLHGSEFHSFSYAQRCGTKVAGELLLSMTPMNSSEAHACHLVDMEVGQYNSDSAQLDHACAAVLWTMLHQPSFAITKGYELSNFRCAPWSTYHPDLKGSEPPREGMSLVEYMSKNKSVFLKHHPIPLVHYRNEELSQMLLDCFHPIRSVRYHNRRYKFIRKVKATGTPARYVTHKEVKPDLESLEMFDDAPGWSRGEEWDWVGLPTPESLKTSETTRIPLYPKSTPVSTPSISHSNSQSDTQGMGSTNTPASPGSPRMTSSSSSSSKIKNMLGGTFGRKTSRGGGTIMAQSSSEDSNLSGRSTSSSSTGSPSSGSRGIETLGTSPIIKDRVYGSPESPSKLQNITKRVSSILQTLGPKSRSRSRSTSLSPPTSPQDTKKVKIPSDSPNQVGSIISAGSGSPGSQSSPRPKRENSLKIKENSNLRSGMLYKPPNVPGAENCEFPCLYNGEEEGSSPISIRRKVSKVSKA